MLFDNLCATANACVLAFAGTTNSVELSRAVGRYGFHFLKQPHCCQRDSAFPRRDCARAFTKVSAQESAWDAGCAFHPRPRVQCVGSTRVSSPRSHRDHPTFPHANGFNGLFRALVSAKSARMCERAALTSRPSLDLSPFVLKGRKSLTGSVGQIRCLPQPEQLHGLRARTEQGRELDDGTK